MNFDFSFKPRLTKELILEHYSEEQIMEFYLRVKVKKGLWRNPLRNDKNPTCSFFRGTNKTLLFKDFATGQCMNCFEVVETLYGCDYFKALKIIANDFNIIHDKTLKKTPGKINSKYLKIEDKEISKIQVTRKEFTELELKWWNKFGITPKILSYFDVYSCKYVFLNDALVAESSQNCPIYGYYGGKIKQDNKKIELWKCYFPKRTSYRFLGNYPAKKLQGYDKLPKKGKICVITKSLKDVMALHAYGIPACAPNSETVIPSEAVVNDLLQRFENVFTLWDNDYTGVTFLNKIKKKYPKLHCLIIPRKLEAKDFSDLRAKYGKNRTRDFIVQYLKWYKNG